jgi:transposase
LKELLGLEKIVDKSLYEALDALEELDFSSIEHKIFEQFKSLHNDNEAIILDVTDTYFAGSQADWKARKGKDGRYDKLLQIALTVTGKYGFPITHKTYEGNINNAMIFKDLIANLALLDFNVTILDRGMICYESINDMMSLKRPIITGLRSNQKILRDFIDPLNKEDIYNPECRVKLKNTAIYVRSFDFMSGKLVAIYNPAIELSKKEKSMEDGTYDPQKAKYYGYSFIFHTTEKSEKDVVTAYFDKDIVEKPLKT